MKILRVILIVLGWLFLFFQMAGYLGRITDEEPIFKNKSIAYIVGYNFLVIFALIFFLIANSLKKRLKRRSEQYQIDSFLNDSANNS